MQDRDLRCAEPVCLPGTRRHRHRPASGQGGPHGIGRVRDRRVEHRVALGLPQPEHLRHRGDQLLGAHASRDRRVRNGLEPEATFQPGRGSPDQCRAPGRRRVAAFTARRRQRLDHARRGRITWRPDGAVDHPSGQGRRQLSQRRHTVVGIWRKVERNPTDDVMARRPRWHRRPAGTADRAGTADLTAPSRIRRNAPCRPHRGPPAG